MSRPTALRPTTAAVGALVALGAAAIVRRTNEARLERTGRLDRLGPHGDDDLPTGRMDARIADWGPTRPSGRRQRAATAAWTAPATVAGLGLAWLGRGRVSWDGERGGWVAVGVGGPSGAVLRRAGMAANTVGQCILCVPDHPSQALLDHEAVHVRQFERLGLAMYPLYLWYSARHGYRTNPLEVAARRGAARRTVSRRRPGATPAR